MRKSVRSSQSFLVFTLKTHIKVTLKKQKLICFKVNVLIDI